MEDSEEGPKDQVVTKEPVPATLTQHGRHATMTTRGAAYAMETKQKVLNQTYTQLKLKMKEATSIMEANGEVSALRHEHKEWLTLYDNFLQTYEQFQRNFPEHTREQQKRLQQLSAFKQAVEEYCLEHSPDFDRASNASGRSIKSRHTSASRSSIQTTASMMMIREEQRKAELMARAAVLKEKHQLELDKLELQKREQQLEIETELAVCNAKTKALEQFEESLHSECDVSVTQVKTFNMMSPTIHETGSTRGSGIHSPLIRNSPVAATATNRNSVTGYSTKVTENHDRVTADVHDDIGAQITDRSSEVGINRPVAPILENTPNANRQTTTESTLEKVLELMTIRNDDLPKKEPDVFKGSTQLFPSWLKSFEILVEKRRPDPADRLYYLSRYTEGDPKEAITGLLILNTEEAYQQAKATLIERYGNKVMVAEAFKQKIRDWPNLRNASGEQLRQFSDFLQNCKIAMGNLQHLQSLNSIEENKRILQKLPRHIAQRWGRVVDSRMYGDANYLGSEAATEADYPSFEEFCNFLKREARIACSLSVYKEEDKDKPKRQGRQTGIGSFASEAKEVEQSGIKETTGHSKQTNGQKKKCVVCKEAHSLDSCGTFQRMTVEERNSTVKAKGLCFGCLIFGHKKQDCKRKKTCDTCGKLHPTLLHSDSRDSGDSVRPKKDSSSAESTTNQETDSTQASNRATTYCLKRNNDVDEGESVCSHSLVVPVEVFHKETPDRKLKVYALLDEQSDACFIKDSVLTSLGISGSSVDLELSTMLAKEVITCYKINGLMVRGSAEGMTISLPKTYSRDVIPIRRSQIPKKETVQRWSHLQAVAEKLEPYSANVEVGLLIGMNCPRAIKPREIVSGGENDPYGIRTSLGWGVVGIMNNAPEETNLRTCHITGSEGVYRHYTYRTQIREVSPAQVTQMFNLDFHERNMRDEKTSVQDRKFLQLVSDGLRLRNDGHFEVPLPFKDEAQLPNNRILAQKRLNSLKRKLEEDAKYKAEYKGFMSKMIENGYAEKAVDDGEIGKTWYIPHHGVYHPQKQKLRVVFDCSAEYKGESLNKHLLQGPDMINNLVGVLCRFREERIAITCDIEGMFHQVAVNPENRNYLRFLWWKDGNLDLEPTNYRMTVHLFGATSSPGCANFALRSAADKFENICGRDAAEFVRKDFYVDDGLKSLKTPDEAISLMNKSTELCKKGGFRLHKFVSNSKTVLEKIPSEERAVNIQHMDLTKDDLPLERTLGVQWCVEADTFQFRVDLKDRPFSRRGILSTISSVFDPLGLVSPFILLGKRILQELCRSGAEWDEPVPNDIRAKWERWRIQLHRLAKLDIPRCHKLEVSDPPKSIELHHFSDASMNGLGQCSYVRIQGNNGKIDTSLVIAKSRVTPSKQVTIPRLELTAAVTSVRVASFLKRELSYNNVSHFFWTDSNVVLGYISNEARRFHVFVANRISEIHEHSSPKQWRHIDSESNPADLASRGASATDLMENTVWWKGPSFLSINEPLPSVSAKNITQDDPEVKKVRVFATQAEVTYASIPERLKRFSTWDKAKRAIVFCLRYMERLKRTHTRQRVKTDCDPVTVEEMKEAERTILKFVQQETHPDEIDALKRMKQEGLAINRASCRQRRQIIKSTSNLYRLDPFMDSDGLLRVGGRIKRANLPREITQPVIIPRRGHVTELIIDHYHRKAAHSGYGMTLSEIRSNGYWIIDGRSAVTSHVYKCVTCRKLRATPRGQKMADLPADRLEPAPPFTYAAVDYFGPFYIKEGRKELKRYGALFTCLASRAIHIEVANSLTTDSFLNAYRRFVCRRGPTRLLRSDQGTNFLGAKGEQEAALKEMNHDKIQRELLKHKCDWINFKMNPPHASHMGGVWERMIRSARNALSALLVTHGDQLNDETLRTLMTEVEAIVNSRPLTYLDTTSSDMPVPLSPSQILTLKTNVVMPPPGHFVKEDIYCRRMWRRVQYLANQFWSRWKVEFLPSLQTRRKWNRPQRDFQPDDVVMMIDETLPRNQWPLARVTKTYMSEDGLVRKVELSTGQTTYERPIHKLIPLVDRGFPVEEPK